MVARGKGGGPVADALRAVMEVVANEAQRNPDFAGRLSAALGALQPPAAGHTASSPGEVAETAEKAPNEVPNLHAINVLREGGVGLLRAKLERVRAKEALRKVAARSGLKLTGAGARKAASRSEVIEAIVQAAEHYDAQRRAAAD